MLCFRKQFILRVILGKGRDGYVFLNRFSEIHAKTILFTVGLVSCHCVCESVYTYIHEHTHIRIDCVLVAKKKFPRSLTSTLLP